MVDVDKQACRNLVERGYCSSLWPESYVTWDFLDRYPKSMEPGYLHLNWNHIPRIYFRKNYMRTLVIEKRDWNHLTDLASLAHYWEPSQGNEDFHRTFALALCKTIYHDCAEASWRKEYVVSVAVVQKLALYAAIPFSNAVDEFEDDLEPSPTLLLVRLHRHLQLFPDLYFKQYSQHFTVTHDSGKAYNVGHPQKFVGALLHNAYKAWDKPSPKAKLPLAFLDHLMKFPVDSCVQDYRDWTTRWGDRPPEEEHIVWLSSALVPFQTDPGTPFVPPDFTLGLPAVEDLPKQAGEVPWILDPAEHPKLAVQSHHESAGPSLGDKRWKRRKKKKKQHRKWELKVTTWGEGKDAPVWTSVRSNSSFSSDSGDSGISSNQRPQHTPRYSPETVRRLDKVDLGDALLSDHGGNSGGEQEMASRDDGAGQVTGTVPIGLAGLMATITSLTFNLMVAPTIPEGSDPQLGDPEDEKDCQGTFPLIMEGFQTAIHTLSDGYQDACKEVQKIVWKSLQKSTAEDHTFIWGSSGAIHQWVRAVSPAMNCIGKSLEEQSLLLQAAREAGKEATEEILNFLTKEDSLYLTPVIAKEDILTLALQAVCKHTETAVAAINTQLSALVHEHILPPHAGVFLATLFQVLCSYQQEMDGMVTSQVVLLGQVIPNIWGVSRTLMEGLTLLGPPNCPASGRPP